MGYRLEYSKQAEKDARLLERAGLDGKAKKLLSVIKSNPLEAPCEKLPNSENLKDENGVPYKGIAHIIRMWTHYE
jgi:hypothetical protein